jgi:hypothetical protein
MSNRQDRTEQDHRGKALLIGGVIGLVVVVVGGVLLVNAWRGSGKGTTDPAAKVRLEKVFAFYQDYTRQNRKPPPDEQAFKEFLSNLSAEEKAIAHLDDVDRFLTSPRDSEKYVIRYGQVIDVGRSPRAVAWEQTGAKGKRFVALSVGYVQECDEATFESYKK